MKLLYLNLNSLGYDLFNFSTGLLEFECAKVTEPNLQWFNIRWIELYWVLTTFLHLSLVIETKTTQVHFGNQKITQFV